MTTTNFEQVFGRTRLRMRTDPHVEVFRDATAPGERRRYTKRFLATARGDLRPWTAREARMLAHLRREGVRCVPERAAFDALAGVMQTYDAGVTIEHWATLLRVERDGQVVPHVFADCAHWWALAHYTLRALETLHRLHVVHLDVKPDNICVPALTVDVPADPVGYPIGLKFARLALIDLAFSVSPAQPFATPLPIGAHPAYPYQSPRLLEALAAGLNGDLRAAQALDWRCDLFSLAAMLRRYLPADVLSSTPLDGWTTERHARATNLLAALDDAHDREMGATWPHEVLIEMCEAGMQDPDLVGSLLDGFTLAHADATPAAPAPSTPLTSIVLLPALAAPIASVADAAANVEPSLADQGTIPIAVARSGRGTSSRRPTRPMHDDDPDFVHDPAPLIRHEETSERHGARSTGEATPSTRDGEFPMYADARPTRPDRRAAGRPVQWRGAGPIALIVFVAAAGIAWHAHDEQRGRSAMSAAEPAAGSVSRPPASRTSEVATIAPDATSRARDPAPVVAAAPATSPRTALSLDAATVQRAAEAESVYGPQLPVHETPSGGVPATSPAAPRDTASAPSGRAAQMAATQATRPREAAPATASATPRRDNTAPGPPDKIASISPLARDVPTPQRQDRPLPSPAAEASLRVAQPEPPAPVPAPAPPDGSRTAGIPPGAFEDVAALTERDVARVLAFAASARGPDVEQRIVEVARSVRLVAQGAHAATGSPAVARRLNAEARAAWERGDIDGAVRMQQRAFQANPNDAEVTGNLAFYYLNVRPAQPALARRLALYAIAARGQKFPAGRVEDWGTLAIASSLEGREADATKALFVMSTVSRSPERACRAARLAVQQYGDTMRAPAGALLARMRERGGPSAAPSCG